MSSDPGVPARQAPGTTPAIGDAWEHRQELVVYARRLLGAHSQMAEDVVQEAYLRLHECAAAGAPVDEPRPWLFRVARNLALDERRRSRRGDDALSSLEVVSSGPRGPLEVLQEREEARQALEGLDALPPRERRTMILDQAGLAPPAIARRMHTTTNAVHQSLFRARRRLRDARAAALGLLPLPVLRLAIRATGSPSLDRLPALAPGPGRFGGGAGLAGLVAATVIGGGVVADRPAPPPAPVEPVPARAAVTTTTASTAPAAVQAAAVAAGPAGRSRGAAGPAAVRERSAAILPIAGSRLREAPARRLVRDAGASRAADGPPRDEWMPRDGGAGQVATRPERPARGGEGGWGARRGGEGEARRDARSGRSGRDDEAGGRDDGGRDRGGWRRGRSGGREGDGAAPAKRPAAPPVTPAPDTAPPPPDDGAVATPEEPPVVSGPEEPAPGTPDPEAAGGGAEAPIADPPPGDAGGPST